MAQEKDNTKTILRLGFVTMIMLLLIVASYSLYRVDQLTQRLITIVEVNNKKIEHTYVMHDVVSKRWISLRKMVATTDPFERDEEILFFYNLALPFRDARDKLMALPISSDEERIMQHLNQATVETQPLVREFATKLSESGKPPESPSLDTIKKQQDKVVGAMQALIDGVKRQALFTVTETRKELSQTYIIMSILTISIILISLAIARIVSHYVNKKNRDLIDAMKVKSRFLANMSHEVRTPLTAIIGFAENLLNTNMDTDERHRTINTIIRNGTQLQLIVDEILDISKDEANRLEVNETNVFLLELISEIKDTFSLAAHKKGLLFEVNYQLPLPTQIHTDPVKLKQILYNLCNNAVKYTEKGTVTFNVSCNIKAQHLHFDIIDSGIGINEQDLQQIFNPFVQVDTSSTRKFGGAGLGLHLSRRFAELLGGTIAVDSDYGHGSCFTFSLPTGLLEKNNLCYEINDKKLLYVTEPKSTDISNIQGNILLAEDTKDIQLLMRAYLKDSLINLITVDNGQQAISAVVQGEFDLILMDIQMPVMNGLEATRQLRNKKWTGPILALTANVLPEDCERYLNEGFDDVIGKPVSRSLFLEKISTYLKPDNIHDAPLIYSTLLKEGPEFLPAIEHFVQQTDIECQQLQDSLDEKNWPDLQQQLHRLKGSGGGVGFPMVTELAKDAEQSIKETNYADTNQYINKLVSILQRLRCTQSTADANPMH